MKTQINGISVYAGTALILMAAVPTVASPMGKKPGAKLSQTPAVVSDVHVANTAAQAIPTVAQGTTTVTGNVKAIQSGAWNVGITGSPNVTIANTPAVTVSGTATVALSGNPGVKIVNSAIAPIPVAVINEGSRQPFQQQVHMDPENSGFSSGYIDVPAGWRLVIEHVNAYGFILQNDGIIDYQLDVTYKGAGAAYEFRPVPVSDSDHMHTVIDLPIVAYADPGSKVAIRMEPSVSGPNAPTASGFAVISGYLEK